MRKSCMEGLGAGPLVAGADIAASARRAEHALSVDSAPFGPRAGHGGLSERPMELVLKTSGQRCPVGSNPTPSALLTASSAGWRCQQSSVDG